MSNESSRIVIESTAGRMVVAGEIDAHTAGDLAAALEPFTDAPTGGSDVSLDLSGVTFMDSSGIRVLIDAHRRVEAAGDRLVVANPSRAVRRLLEISGLTDHLNVTHADETA
jgi:anti-anti-sigma factor